jgi:hypothetical protein
LAAVGETSGAVNEQSRGFFLYDHLRDQILVHLELADFLTELFSLVRVAYGVLASRLGETDGAGGAT